MVEAFETLYLMVLIICYSISCDIMERYEGKEVYKNGYRKKLWQSTDELNI